MATNNQLPNCPPLRFPEFNDEWKQTTLGEIVDVLNSKRRPITSTERVKGNYPYYGASGIIDYVNDFIFEEQLLLVGEDGAKWGGHERTAFIVSGKFWVNNHAHVLRVKNVSVDKFIEACLILKNLQRYVTGDAPPKLTLDNLKAIPLSLPSLAEQQKIATFLSLLDERIEAQRQTIEERKKQKKALLQQIFSQSLRFPGFSDEWQQTTLGESYSPTMGQSPSSLFYNTNQEGLPLIQGAADMQGGRTIIRVYSSEGSKRAQRGDIILSVRAPVGRVVLTDFNCFIGRGVCAIASQNKYLFYFLQFYEKTWSKFASGSTFDSITGKDVNELTLSLPSLSEQEHIANFLSLIDERIEVEERLLQKYEEQKRYLLRKMFV